MEQLKLSKSQTFISNSDNDDTENDVVFLVEVRVPCLVCGVDVEFDTSGIKQEVDYFEESADDSELGLNIRSAVDHDVFHGFLKWFEVDIVKKRKHGQVNEKGWDGKGGDILRFCANCKMELMKILEFQKQLDELEKKVKNGMVEVKRKMESFENTFQSNGIYERDKRLKLVRNKIVNCGPTISAHSSKDEPHSSMGQLGDCNREEISPELKVDTNVVQVNPDPTKNTNVSMDKVAVVMISSADKASADRYLISNYPDISTFNTNTGKPLPETNIIKKVQKAAQVNGPIAPGKPFCPKLVKNKKKSVQRKVTSCQVARINKKLIKTPIPTKSRNKSNCAANVSVLKNNHSGNDNQRVNENVRESSSRPLRNQRKVNYATGALIDDKHDNSIKLSVGDKDSSFKRCRKI